MMTPEELHAHEIKRGQIRIAKQKAKEAIHIRDMTMRRDFKATANFPWGSSKKVTISSLCNQYKLFPEEVREILRNNLS